VLLTAAVLAAVGAAGALAAPHLWAAYQLAAGRSALERGRDEARGRLEACLRVWPDCAEAHLLAARAIRRAGYLDDDALAQAQEHVRTCQRLQKGPSEDVALEWACLHAAGGDLADVEDYLHDYARKHPDRAPLAWEALTQGYVRAYRTHDALDVLRKWLDARPDDETALALHGDVYWQGNSPARAVDDYRRVVQADPDRTEVRRRLAVGLIESGRYEEALGHLEQVRAKRPDDPDVLVLLARCYTQLDRPRQADDALRAALAARPGYGPALRTRGQIARRNGRPDEAEEWLREAVRAKPEDYQANFALGQALSEEGKDAEAKAQLARAEKIKDRNERVGEIVTCEMSMRPHDAALHAELGKLLIERGDKDAGERWLLSALALDSHLKAAHAALADYYQSQGDSEKAEEHRREAGAAAGR
jgi:predicted Zn-dependent protease